MSKELTEQWRNGTLPNGKTFWCQDDEGNVAKLINIRGKFFEWTISEQDDTEQVKEVLAPVPSYEQYKLNEDTISDLLWKLELSVQSEVNLTKKVEKLEKQLNEANEVIKDFVKPKPFCILCTEETEKLPESNEIKVAKEYLEKYGVENE